MDSIDVASSQGSQACLAHESMSRWKLRRVHRRTVAGHDRRSRRPPGLESLHVSAASPAKTSDVNGPPGDWSGVHGVSGRVGLPFGTIDLVACRFGCLEARIRRAWDLLGTKLHQTADLAKAKGPRAVGRALYSEAIGDVDAVAPASSAAQLLTPRAPEGLVAARRALFETGSLVPSPHGCLGNSAAERYDIASDCSTEHCEEVLPSTLAARQLVQRLRLLQCAQWSRLPLRRGVHLLAAMPRWTIQLLGSFFASVQVLRVVGLHWSPLHRRTGIARLSRGQRQASSLMPLFQPQRLMYL